MTPMEIKVAYNIARHILIHTELDDEKAASNIAVADSLLRKIEEAKA